MSSDNSVPKIRTALCNFMRKTAHSVKPCQTTKCSCTFRLTYNKRMDKKKIYFLEFFFIILIAKCKNVARQFRVENKDGNFMMSQEKARLILLPADKLTSGYCIYMSYFYRQIAKCNCNFRLTYLPISLWTKQSIVFVLFFIIIIAKC